MPIIEKTREDQEVVFDRLRQNPKGLTVGALNRALGWSRGARAALQRLQSQGRAYERGELWFHVPGPQRR
jgi:hypothetical protein